MNVFEEPKCKRRMGSIQRLCVKIGLNEDSQRSDRVKCIRGSVDSLKDTKKGAASQEETIEEIYECWCERRRGGHLEMETDNLLQQLHEKKELKVEREVVID